jgi:hypothetical protein
MEAGSNARFFFIHGADIRRIRSADMPQNRKDQAFFIHAVAV